jgi:protein-tyrosine phosphatase
VSDPSLVDLHCHLVPGVDDGARDLGEAIAQLETFRELGIRQVVTTPHLAASAVRSSWREEIDAAFGPLLAAAAEAVPEVRLGLSYEFRLDDPDADLSDRSIGLGQGGALLVEFPMLALPAYPDRMLELVVASGWRPVLAHPERYAGVERAYGWIARWREMGALMCANAGSLWGEHGAEAQRVVRRMLADGSVDLVASDNHARPNRTATVKQAWDYLEAAGCEEQARLLTAVNPAAVLADDPPVAVPPCEPGAGWVDRLLRFVKGGSR